jgi:hypothetical protein
MTIIITDTKKNFLRKISGGINTLMASSYLSDEIGLQPFGIVEEFISRRLLVYDTNAVGVPRHWFSDYKFDLELDTMFDNQLTDFLLYLDNVDITIKRVFSEAYLSYDDMNDDEYDYAKLIENNYVTTFKDFLSIKN